jgi:hypothetical protein
VALILPVVAILLVCIEADISSFNQLWQLWIAWLDDDLQEIVIYAVGTLIAILVAWALGAPRLFIDETGVYKTGARIDRLFGYQLNWSIAATSIDHIAYVEAKSTSAPAQIKIVDVFRQTKTLMPIQWYLPAKKLVQHQKVSDIFISTDSLRRKHRELPLVTALQSKGYKIKFPELQPSNTVAGFDLMRNKSTALAVGLIVSFFFYAMFDAVLFTEYYVAGYPIFLIGSFGLFVGIVVYAINIMGKVPAVVALGVGVVTVFAAMVAAYPGLLRINALMDSEGLQTVQYMHDKGYEYRALDPAWPDITVPNRVHWSNTTIAEPIDVPIRKGGLDIYQADFEALFAGGV